MQVEEPYPGYASCDMGLKLQYLATVGVIEEPFSDGSYQCQNSRAARYEETAQRHAQYRRFSPRWRPSFP
jgi:hypothetical protein